MLHASKWIERPSNGHEFGGQRLSALHGRLAPMPREGPCSRHTVFTYLMYIFGTDFQQAESGLVKPLSTLMSPNNVPIVNIS